MTLIPVASTDRPLAFGDYFAPFIEKIGLNPLCYCFHAKVYSLVGRTKLIYINEIMITSRLRHLFGFISGKDNVPPTPRS